MEKTAGRAISMADAPDIPGLAFRGFRGEADYPLMLAVREASKEADGVERISSLEDIARSLRVIKDQGMTEAALGVDADGATGALHLYEVLGFRPVKRMSLYRKPMEE